MDGKRYHTSRDQKKTRMSILKSDKTGYETNKQKGYWRERRVLYNGKRRQSSRKTRL